MSRWWYFLAAVPFALGFAVTIPGFVGMARGIKEMQRIVVPGQRDLTLEPGDYVIYGETSSTVDGVAYVNTGFHIRCGATAADGSAVDLKPSSVSTSYSFGDYSGQSMFELAIASPGSYRVTCEGDGDKAVIAIGRGIGGSILAMIAAFLGSILFSGVAFFVIRRKRKRSRG